jgi:hypothetical protein
MKPALSAQCMRGTIPYRKLRQLPNEQDRWLRGVSAAEATIDNAEGRLIHVMDSEADDYDSMAGLVHDRRRWVIHVCQDRALVQPDPSEAVARRAGGMRAEAILLLKPKWGHGSTDPPLTRSHEFPDGTDTER